MRIQFLNGGLANQAFQYIFSRYYMLSHPGQVMYLDDSYFAQNTVHNGYELEKVFGIRAPMLSECFSDDVWAFILAERKAGKSVPQVLTENGIPMYMVSEVKEEYGNFNPFAGEVRVVPQGQYIPEIQDWPENVYYHGYWITKEWFQAYQNVFWQEFQFPEIEEPWNLEYARQIGSSESAAIHVRRGDYVTLKWAFDTDTYRMLVNQFRGMVFGRWKLFVFSDDIAWCREHAGEMGFDLFDQVVYVEGNGNGLNYRDMQLMSMCKGMILSNSAFCYLAALLNRNRKMVINPMERMV
ncbi:MAG: alpha-1,2-fucosyltransferase [Lachnospiraceae bacterium]|nr:alpha-1,2-fucosyltransferase [Lachnospiraceae bacterium]